MLTEQEARLRAARVENVSYDVTTTLVEKSPTHRERTLIQFTAKETSADLRVDFKTDGLKSVSINGTKITGEAQPGQILIPAANLRPGSNVIEVHSETPYDRADGVHRFFDPADGREYVYTDFEPFQAHRWFPCFDQPDLKATLHLTVIAPNGWQVVANMPVISSQPEGECRRHQFQPTPKLSTYLMAMVAGPYQVFTDPESKIPSRIFSRQSLASYVDTADIFDITRKGLAFFPEFFGTPYPFPKYDQLFVPEFSAGAMENPGAVTFNEERFLFRHQPTSMDRLRRASVILHEMAHMWFGDLVTMRWWNGLWLNESFADYMATVALEQATQHKSAFEQFLDRAKAWAYWQDQLPTTHPVAGSVSDTDTAFTSFDGITYGKGASLLKQLAFKVGTPAFKTGLQSYFSKYAWGSTEIDDFFGELGRAAETDLTGWARQHLETSGVNAIKIELRSSGGRISGCTVEQLPGNGDAVLRSHVVQLATYQQSGLGKLSLSSTHSVVVDGAKTEVSALVGQPVPAFLWPNSGDYGYLRVFLDPDSLKLALQQLDRIPDTMTRRGVWMTLWEMVRDRQLSPKDYLNAFCAQVALEGDSGLIEGLFPAVQHTLDWFLGEERDSWSDTVHKVAWNALVRAEAGSDTQKTWFGLVVHTAVSDASLSRLEGMLAGSSSVPGLELDPEKRWRIVIQISTRGRNGAKERIVAQLAQDPTAFGEKRALTAEASLPEPAIKEAFFSRILSDKGSSVDVLSAAMAGFHRPGQGSIVKPFTARYFEALPTVKDTNGPEFARAFALRMFPVYTDDPEVLKQAEAVLAAHTEMPADVRKPLLNNVDDLARALAVRGKR